jgi:hypothetical protein
MRTTRETFHQATKTNRIEGNNDELSIPCTRSIDTQQFTKKCSKSCELQISTPGLISIVQGTIIGLKKIRGPLCRYWI